MNHESNHQITFYKPNQRRELGFFQTWVVMTKNVIRSRDLIWVVFKRDFLAGYKKTFIGFTWIFISPIIGIISWIFLQKTGMLQPGKVGIPYPAYVLIGSSMWGLFVGFFTSASQTLEAGSTFIMQVNYPHEALLFKQVAQQLAEFLINFILNIIVLLVFNVVPSWKAIFLPLVILPLFFLGAAFGLIFSMISVISFDISKTINIIMGPLIFTTPVIYSDKVDNSFVQAIIKWNPLTYLVCSARDIIIYGRLYVPVGYVICAGFALVVFLISWRLFYVAESRLIERMI